MSRIRTLLAGAAIAVVSAGATVTPASAHAPWYGSCPKGDVCVWSGHNGTGTRCAWTGDDPDWRSGSVQCRPHGFRVNSIWNNGHPGAYDVVQFFKHANYRTPYGGPVPAGQRGNVDDLEIRSHVWTNP
ncbi:peptidase inhibitor family I36 protein [Actinorugispora endophytica]|uniref:Peptidase inhibitor family I36 n=1 Tax=Actinorugispora endophytica TaxID=1605990 RepID=A0A4R6V0P6_9ACTN|nr:peptidase inhibitor family I36 protein [Actinorugispora endophytica]TDQ53480.1 peptidase inhibitor family I36 [Actinorugispora endophytica]